MTGSGFDSERCESASERLPQQQGRLRFGYSDLVAEQGDSSNMRLERPSPWPRAQRLGAPAKWAILALAVFVVALGGVVAVQRITTTTSPPSPSLPAQFAEWMSANTRSDIQISRVSCLDPAAGGALVTCQFTATVDSPGGTSTYFHDFKCPATLDLAGKVTHVECPTDSAWMFSETTAVPAV